jgi:hypothetical protein
MAKKNEAPAAGAQAKAGAKASAEPTRKQKKIYFSDAEWAEVGAAAEARGMAPSEFLRETMLEGIRTGRVKTVTRVIRPAVNEATIRELNRIGVNLNQIARVADEAKELPSYFALSHALDQLLLAIRRL